MLRVHIKNYFTRQFKCRYYIINAGDSGPILENWNVWPEM